MMNESIQIFWVFVNTLLSSRFRGIAKVETYKKNVLGSNENKSTN